MNFRVWDIEQKQMVYFNFSDISSAKFLNKPSYQYVWDISKNPCQKSTRITETENPIMRGSGFNDMIGNEIFEGDLVELHQAIQPVGFGLYEIFYCRGAFQLKEIKPNWVIKFYDHCLHYYNICKIVGNIHQNRLDKNDLR